MSCEGTYIYLNKRISLPEHESYLLYECLVKAPFVKRIYGNQDWIKRNEVDVFLGDFKSDNVIPLSLCKMLLSRSMNFGMGK